MGRIINAMHRLNEKLITIWKSEGLVAKGEIRPPGWTTIRFFESAS